MLLRNKIAELTDRHSYCGRDIGSDEARYGRNAATDARNSASVLRRDVHGIGEEAGIDEAAQTDGQNEQHDGQCCLSTVHVTQSNQKHSSAKHTCNQPTDRGHIRYNIDDSYH